MRTPSCLFVDAENVKRCEATEQQPGHPSFARCGSTNHQTRCHCAEPRRAAEVGQAAAWDCGVSLIELPAGSGNPRIPGSR